MVELGGVEDGGTYEEFVDGILAADISVEDGMLTYDSPTRGLVQVAWEGPMTVAGETIDLGPYPRFHNAGCHQERGDRVVRIEHAGQRLELDFEKPERRVIALP